MTRNDISVFDITEEEAEVECMRRCDNVNLYGLCATGVVMFLFGTLAVGPSIRQDYHGHNESLNNLTTAALSSDMVTTATELSFVSTDAAKLQQYPMADISSDQETVSEYIEASGGHWTEDGLVDDSFTQAMPMATGFNPRGHGR